MNTNNDLIKQAYKTAKDTLKDRYTDLGIQAGKNHFSDLWVRDGCYASLGALSIGDVEVVKATIKTLLKYQHENGQIPLRVGQKWFLLKYLGVDAKTPQARFTEDKGISIPTDSNSLFLIILEKYIEQTQDKALLITHFNKIKAAMNWNFAQDITNDLLMEEGYYSGWADSLKKSGTVLYTNVLHYKATQSFASLCEYLGKKEEADHYRYLGRVIQENMTKLFWNGHYFMDWISPQKVINTNFSTDGNLFAIIFGLATQEQGLSIQNFIKKNAMDTEFSTHTVFPRYGASKIYSLFHLIRIHDYHNGLQWLWMGCIDAVSKSMLGMQKEAEALLLRIAKKIIEHDGVYEVYHNGTPVKRNFYSSEKWFAWSAGLFVWACHQIGIVK